MKRPLRPDEVRVWAEVLKTVDPAPGRVAPEVPAAPVATGVSAPAMQAAAAAPQAAPRRTAPAAPPEDVEPGRKRRLVRERDPIEARIDLHGYGYDAARAALTAFVQRAHSDGARAVLVITGKGSRSGAAGGVLRDWAPQWLSEPPLRALVAGVSQAHRRHGGEGALYVALKRPPLKAPLPTPAP